MKIWKGHCKKRKIQTDIPSSPICLFFERVAWYFISSSNQNSNVSLICSLMMFSMRILSSGLLNKVLKFHEGDIDDCVMFMLSLQFLYQGVSTSPASFSSSQWFPPFTTFVTEEVVALSKSTSLMTLILMWFSFPTCFFGWQTHGKKITPLLSWISSIISSENSSDKSVGSYWCLLSASQEQTSFPVLAMYCCDYLIWCSPY